MHLRNASLFVVKNFSSATQDDKNTLPINFFHMKISNDEFIPNYGNQIFNSPSSPDRNTTGGSLNGPVPLTVLAATVTV